MLAAELEETTLMKNNFQTIKPDILECISHYCHLQINFLEEHMVILHKMSYFVHTTLCVGAVTASLCHPIISAAAISSVTL